MDKAIEGFEAHSEAIVFLDYFKDFPDPRQRAKVIYPLDEVLLLCLLAVLGGAEIGDKIERETRFHITSLVMLAHALGPVIRGIGRSRIVYIGSRI
jgi:DDE_Tnp_1-associated